MRPGKSVAIPVLGAAGVSAAAIAAAEYSMRSRRSPLRPEDMIKAAGVAASGGAALSEARMRAVDGADLRGWLFRRNAVSGRAVVLLHGVSAARGSMLDRTQFFLTHGYDVLTPDSRAEGESGGELVTYGLLEAGDANDWAGWLQDQTGARCVFGLGESMGAGVLIQAIARKTPLCAAVAESPFPSFRDTAYLRIGAVVGGGERVGKALGFPLVELAMLYARLRYRLDLRRASSLEAVPHAKVPLLIIQGTADRNIPVEHSRRMARAAEGRAQYWEVPGGGHTGAFPQEPAEYARRVLTLFESAAAASGHAQPARLSSPEYRCPR